MARAKVGRIGLAAASVVLLAAASATAQAPAPKATTRDGVVVGEAAPGLSIFRGIPYAAPPVGPLRWRPPQPHPGWKGERPARTFGFDCVQTPFPGDSTPSIHTQSEDCLALNVWRPEGAKGGAPVMVWIHGGGFTNGLGSSPVFDGAALARAGVVVVTFNYRLGRFGFFAHPALTADRPDEPKGNYGFMDQIAALRWVQANIAGFGGDPARVTVFGESAGGASVNMLMASPMARGLFARASVPAGGLGDTWPCLDEAERKGVALAEARGLGSADAATLRALPLEVVKGDVNLFQGRPETYSGPMVDGKVGPRALPALFAAGQAAAAPPLAGANTQEFGPASPFIAARTEAALKRLPDETQGALRAAYGDDLAAGLGADAAFVAPARLFAGHQARVAPTYLYRFDVVPAGQRRPGVGARHATDLPYVFGTLPASLGRTDEADSRASETIRAYWTNFAKTGDPNGPGLPAWPSYGPGDRAMTLSADGATTGPHPHAARLDAIAGAIQLACPAG